jgi:hypothetical protein
MMPEELVATCKTKCVERLLLRACNLNRFLLLIFLTAYFDTVQGYRKNRTPRLQSLNLLAILLTATAWYLKV